MHKAIHVRPYSGDLFYQHGRDYMTLNLSLSHDEQGNIQTLIRRTDSPSIEVESRSVRLSYAQDSSPLSTDSLRAGMSSIPGLGEWLENCGNHYTFDKTGRAQVAGRNAVVIKIEPKTLDRNQMQMWLDEATAIPLRVEISEPEQPHSVLESMSFTNVSFDPIDQTLLEAYEFDHPNRGSAFEEDVTIESLEQEAAQIYTVDSDETDSEDPCLRTQNNCWQMDYLPDGFTLTSTSGIKTKSGYGGIMMFHSDGVTTFSVFIQPFTKEMPTQVMQRGSTLVVSRTLDTVDETRYLVSAVGDIPEVTAVRIAEGIRHLK